MSVRSKGARKGLQSMCLRKKINDLARLRGKDLKEGSEEAKPRRRLRKRENVPATPDCEGCPVGMGPCCVLCWGS